MHGAYLIFEPFLSREFLHVCFIFRAGAVLLDDVSGIHNLHTSKAIDVVFVRDGALIRNRFTRSKDKFFWRFAVESPVYGPRGEKMMSTVGGGLLSPDLLSFLVSFCAAVALLVDAGVDSQSLQIFRDLCDALLALLSRLPLPPLTSTGFRLRRLSLFGITREHGPRNLLLLQLAPRGPWAMQRRAARLRSPHCRHLNLLWLCHRTCNVDSSTAASEAITSHCCRCCTMLYAYSIRRMLYKCTSLTLLFRKNNLYHYNTMKRFCD